MLFSAPAFLWGLLALLVPVIVHLFNFRRYKRVYFSNVDRLQQLQTQSRRHRNVRSWVVLALRCLALAFLVLAFARPVIPNRSEGIRNGSTAVSIYIDNSFSMDAATADGSLIDMARVKARESAAAYAISDRFQLITSDLNGADMRWLSRDEFLDAIDQLQPSPASPMLSEVVRRQRHFLHQSAAHNQHAYLLSDFQRSISDLDRLGDDSVARLTLVPLAGSSTDNIYIDSLLLDAPSYFRGGDATVEVRVHNGGDHAVEKMPVRLYVNERERALATIDLAPHATATAALRFALDSEGWLDGRVEIDDYPITFDDSYHFSIHVGQPIKALEVDGGERNPHLKKLFDEDPTVDYRATTNLPQLEGIDFVVLNEPKRLPSGEAMQLTQWVADGGSLLVVPGANADPTDLNALLQALGAPQLSRWAKSVVKANQIDLDNSLYRGVFAGRSEEMEVPTVQGHYTTATGQSARQPIISLADGSEMLSHTVFGEGHLYLMTTPLGREWTDLVAQALFVPTFYNMALFSRKQPMVAHTLGDPTPIELQGTYSADATPPELTDSATFSLLPDLRRMGNRHVIVPHGELRHAGIYTLADEHLAFNYSRRESELDFLSADEVAKSVANTVGISTIENSSHNLEATIRERDGGRQLWRLCLVLALVALAIETLVIKLPQQ